MNYFFIVISHGIPFFDGLIRIYQHEIHNLSHEIHQKNPG